MQNANDFFFFQVRTLQIYFIYSVVLKEIMKLVQSRVSNYIRRVGQLIGEPSVVVTVAMIICPEINHAMITFFIPTNKRSYKIGNDYDLKLYSSDDEDSKWQIKLILFIYKRHKWRVIWRF